MNCLVCGADHAGCGDPYTGHPIDMTLITSRALGHPAGGPTVEEERTEMLRVKIGPNDIRRVNPRDKDEFMAAYPGAEVLDGAPAEYEPDTKALEPAENKAQAMRGAEKK